MQAVTTTHKNGAWKIKSSNKMNDSASSLLDVRVEDLARLGGKVDVKPKCLRPGHVDLGASGGSQISGVSMVYCMSLCVLGEEDKLKFLERLRPAVARLAHSKDYRCFVPARRQN